ncbi:uncharacterized protein C8Q71DRAFT_694164, partial [Rhodofomes roseus]
YMVLTLMLLCGVSRRHCNWVLDIIRFAFDLLQAKLGLVTQIPNDIRTLLRRFDLDPEVKAYICCPECFCLYPDNKKCPDRCTHKAYEDAPLCHAELFETRALK